MKRMIKQDIYGMARVGYSGDLEVYVNTDDGGNLPHFHIRLKNNWDKFHSCIRLDCSEYFLHVGKEDKLNSHQRKILQQFMEDPVELPKYKSKFNNNWELACFLWDTNNSDVIIDDSVIQPDYRNLE